jgi:hypothetical protein
MSDSEFLDRLAITASGRRNALYYNAKEMIDGRWPPEADRSADRMRKIDWLNRLLPLSGRNAFFDEAVAIAQPWIEKEKDEAPEQPQMHPIAKPGGWWEFSDGTKERGMSEDEAIEHEMEIKRENA